MTASIGGGIRVLDLVLPRPLRQKNLLNPPLPPPPPHHPLPLLRLALPPFPRRGVTGAEAEAAVEAGTETLTGTTNLKVTAAQKSLGAAEKNGIGSNPTLLHLIKNTATSTATTAIAVEKRHATAIAVEKRHAA